MHLLPKSDADAAHRLMGTVIDRINLDWLVRYRFVYGLSPTETYYYLIRHGHQLHRERILHLVELESIEAVVQALPAALRETLAPAHTALMVEQLMDGLVRRRARHDVRYSRSMVTRAIAYLILREHQLDSLRALILGTRLGLAPALVTQALSLEPEKAA